MMLFQQFDESVHTTTRNTATTEPTTSSEKQNNCFKTTISFFMITPFAHLLPYTCWFGNRNGSQTS